MVAALLLWLSHFFIIIIITSSSSLLIHSPVPSSDYRGSFWPAPTQKGTTRWSYHIRALVPSKPSSLSTLRPWVITDLHQNALDTFSLREVKSPGRGNQLIPEKNQSASSRQRGKHSRKMTNGTRAGKEKGDHKTFLIPEAGKCIFFLFSIIMKSWASPEQQKNNPSGRTHIRLNFWNFGTILVSKGWKKRFFLLVIWTNNKFLSVECILNSSINAVVWGWV